ncbi:MAG: sulfide/dihydroorotate dehydrogenase-like FAD/NAD-binding protein [Candidatus Omnitrophica bacterium]|nr:sulfide/dihydroorotate dehydrogenase-like FAD/NAD-binding protein [Candidatus Omnitrophota bacterium]
MNRIVKKTKLNEQVTLMDIEAPHVVKNARPGQFVVLHINEAAERIPLTICGKDPEKGAITVIFQIVGCATSWLELLEVGDVIHDILGPLGQPTEIRNYGKVICVGGGVGVAELLPVAKALKDEGNFVVSIIGARNKDLLILKKEMEDASSKLLIATDDGSLGHKGFVTDLFQEELSKDNYEMTFCVGPIPMMRRTCELARANNAKIKVSLNSNMVDATGMCGTCRITVGGKTYFTCVDGPEFDGLLVDFDELQNRDKRFAQEERISFEEFKKRHQCVNRTQKKE